MERYMSEAAAYISSEEDIFACLEKYSLANIKFILLCHFVEVVDLCPLLGIWVYVILQQQIPQ